MAGEALNDVTENADVVFAVVRGANGDVEAVGEVFLSEAGGGTVEDIAGEALGTGESPGRGEGDALTVELCAQEGGVERGVVGDEERGVRGRGHGVDEGTEGGDDLREARDVGVGGEVVWTDV